MRALRNCDFCDREAVGTFEVVPPELEPDESDQRRVVLCTACRARLENLLEPLLDRLGAERVGRGEGGRSETVTPAAGEPIAFGADADAAEEAGGGTGSSTGESGRSNEDDSDPSSSVAVRSDTDADESAGVGDESTSDANASTDDAPSRSETADAPEAPPKAYGKVVRLLKNREFPMERADVEGLAAGAYQLEDHEVDAVIERALEQGEFVEDGSQLRRP